jgi:hypothetical protein
MCSGADDTLDRGANPGNEGYRDAAMKMRNRNRPRDDEAVLVMFDEALGYVPGNVAVISRKGARLIEKMTPEERRLACTPTDSSKH